MDGPSRDRVFSGLSHTPGDKMSDRNAAGATPTAEPATSVGAYYPWLDALRGISWILVMIGHTTEFGYLARMGVGIFFAISGWLITRIILGSLDRKWSLVTFYTRRAIRIIPLYYVLIVVAVSSSLLFPRWKLWFEWLPSDVPEHALWPYLLTFATEYWRGGGGGFLVGHAWSLGVEERFYVFWPLLLTLWPGVKASRRVLIVALIALYWAALRMLPNGDVTIALWAMPFPLLFGCALAIFAPFPLQSFPRKLTMPAGAIAFGAYVVFAAVVERMEGPTVCTFSLVPGVLAALLTAAAIATAGDSRNLLFRALQEAGKLSYAAYLFHPIFAFLAIKAARALGIPWIGPVLGIAMIGPVAFLIHRYVETPFLNLRPRVERSRNARVALSVLQTGPIVVGLAFLFPWRDLGGQFARHPGLLGIAAVVLGGMAFAAALRAGQGWALLGLDRLTAISSATHQLLRRWSWLLNAVAGVAVVSVALVALTGGFRWSFGPGLLLSVRSLDRPIQLLIVAAALRLVAAMAPVAPVAPVPTAALGDADASRS